MLVAVDAKVVSHDHGESAAQSSSHLVSHCQLNPPEHREQGQEESCSVQTRNLLPSTWPCIQATLGIVPSRVHSGPPAVLLRAESAILLVANVLTEPRPRNWSKDAGSDILEERRAVSCPSWIRVNDALVDT